MENGINIWMNDAEYKKKKKYDVQVNCANAAVDEKMFIVMVLTLMLPHF